MVSGQVLISTWDRICVALDCQDKRTAKKRCDALGIKIIMINGVAHINGDELKRKTK